MNRETEKRRYRDYAAENGAYASLCIRQHGQPELAAVFAQTAWMYARWSLDDNMEFHDYTVLLDGTLRSHRTHETAALVPEAVDVFRHWLRDNPGDDVRKPIPDFEGFELHWTTTGAGSAIGTFYVKGRMATTSVLDQPGTRAGLEELEFILTELRGDDTKPPIRLDIENRPSVVTLPWPFAGMEVLPVLADMETCLAAAYFTGGSL